MKKIIAGLGVMILSVSSPATLITLSCTAWYGEGGYVAGQSYEFTIDVNDAYTQNPGDAFTSTWSSWVQSGSADSPVVTDFYGDGFLRDYVPASTPQTSLSMSYIAMMSYHQLQFNVYNDPSSGLMTSAGKRISRVVVNIPVAMINYPGEYVDPAVALSELSGTNINSSPGSVFLYASDTTTLGFTVNHATIEAVPEPATAMILALGGALIAGYRRFFGRT